MAMTPQASRTLGIFAAMMLVWSVVWLVKSHLDGHLHWIRGEYPTAIYWLVAKIVVWIAPAIWLVRMSGKNLASQINLVEWRRWLFWGTAIGIPTVIAGLAPKIAANAPLFPHALDPGTLNILIVAPLFEEFLIRAAILGNLIPAVGFLRANILSAICFVVLHVPGWYMMGTLTEKLSQPVGGAISLFVLGLGFGWATVKGRSFLAGSIAHFFNNLAA